eukprot:gene23677-32052_t
MVRKKAAPVQSEIQRHQIEVHEDHSKENDEYMHDFAGPVVFYEYFSQRTSENVLFRRKHTSFPIYFSKQASDERIHTRSKRKEWEIRIRNPSRRLGLLAAYLIKVQSTENNSGCAGCHVQMISSFYLDCISDGNELVTQFPFLKHDKQKSNMCLVFYYNTNEGHASSSIPIFIQVQSFIQAICHGLEFNSATANSYIAIVDLELHAMLRDQQAVVDEYCSNTNKIVRDKKPGRKRKSLNKNVSAPITPINRFRDHLQSVFPTDGMNITMRRMQTSLFQTIQPPTFRLDLSVIRTAATSTSPTTLSVSNAAKEKTATVYFHFVAASNNDGDEGNSRTFKTERRDCLDCPWCSKLGPSPCSLEAGQGRAKDNSSRNYLSYEQYTNGHRYTLASYEHLQRLRFHLEHTHFQFHYEYVVYSDMNLHVVIHRQRNINVPNPRDSYYHRVSRLAKEKYFSASFLRYLRDEDKEDDELDDEVASSTSGLRRTSRKSTLRLESVEQQQQQLTIKRPYYNSITGRQQLQESDCNYDSDEKLDLSFDLKLALRRIDDFIDISYEDKQLMKLWNNHIHTFPPYGDRLILLVCQRFVQRFANVIVNNNLRYNLLLHLMHLWDLGLLMFEEVERCMEVVDRYYYQQRVKAGDILPSRAVEDAVEYIT